MALVKFVRGTKPVDLSSLDADTIYFFSDTHEIYLGQTPYSGDFSDLESDLETLQGKVTQAEADIDALESWKATHQGEYEALTAADEDFEERISALEDAFENAGDGEFESLEDLIDAVKSIKDEYVKSVTAADTSVTVTTGQTPTVKVNISSKEGNALGLDAVNGGLYVDPQLLPDEATTDYTVTVTEEGTPTEGYAKTYTIAQPATSLNAKIDIPKDMVVSSGAVVNQDGSGGEGTFIKLVLNNGQELYIDVKDLVDEVEAGTQAGNPVQIVVEDGHTITATLVEGGVTASHLATAVKTDIQKGVDAYTALTWGSLE